MPYHKVQKLIPRFYKKKWHKSVFIRNNGKCYLCLSNKSLLIRTKNLTKVLPLIKRPSIDDYLLICSKCFLPLRRGKNSPVHGERNRELITLASMYKIEEVAKKFGLTTQRVSQISIREGNKELSDIFLARKKEAMKVADQYNHFKNKQNTPSY